MIALVQRARDSRVEIGGETAGGFTGPGLVIFLGVTHSDGEKEADWLAHKCANLRIFEDGEGKMNRSLADVGGSMLIVSQFTLYGDASRGFRPGFTAASRPEHSEPLYERFVRRCSETGIPVSTGRFGADMQVYIQNDGPVTLIVDTARR